MVYEWRCTPCRYVAVITRPAVDYDIPPDFECTQCKATQWEKKISLPHYDMEHMFDKGIFERIERFPIL